MATPFVKKQVDPFVLFSKKKVGQESPLSAQRQVLVSDSDEESSILVQDSKFREKFQPQKLSFSDTFSPLNKSKNASILGKNKVLLLHSDSDSSISDDPNAGQEDDLVKFTKKLCLNDDEEDSFVRIGKKKKRNNKNVINEDSNDDTDDDDEKEETEAEKVKKSKKKVWTGFLNSSSEDDPDAGRSVPNLMDYLVDSDDDRDDSFVVPDDEVSEEDGSYSEEEVSADDVEDDDDTDGDDESSNNDDGDKSPPVVRKEVPRRPEQQQQPVKVVREVLTKTFLDSLSLEEIVPCCHPDAIKYLKNFAKNKKELAHKLYKMFNVGAFDTCLPTDMELVWKPRLLTTAGTCEQRLNHLTKERTSRINLSTKVLDTADRLRDTLIHEMCHAGSWLISGYKGGHGPLWKWWATRAANAFPELPIISRCHNYKVHTKYQYKCIKCFHKYGRHSKSLDVDRKRCGRCKTGGLLELYIFDKRKGHYRQADQDDANADGKPPQTPKTPNVFAMFVKENYKTCRTPGTTHAQAMKAISKMFAETKISAANKSPSVE